MSEQTTIPEPATVTPSPSPQDPLPMLLARIEALESDVAQSKAKVQEALARLLAEPPTL